MLFLVKGEIRKTEYMKDSQSFEATHLVEAVDEDEAKALFTAHYENQSYEYDVRYRVDDVDVFPMLSHANVVLKKGSTQ